MVKAIWNSPFWRGFLVTLGLAVVFLPLLMMRDGRWGGLAMMLALAVGSWAGNRLSVRQQRERIERLNLPKR